MSHEQTSSDVNTQGVPFFIGGCLAGSANILVGYPFDTVKTRLQGSPAGTYKGPFNCLTRIWKYEGVRGLYRGLTSPLIGGAVETGINYLVFQSLRQALKEREGLAHHVAVPAAAGAAGVVLSFVLAPVELIKCRLQMGVQGRSYRGPYDCLQKLLESEGWRGLTRGLPATICREAPGNIIYFSTYEALRRNLPGGQRTGARQEGLRGAAADAGGAILCGGLAGMTMWSVVLPIDVAKTRIQTAFPGSPHDVGILQQLRMLWREGRLRSLYAGLTPTLIRSFPANAAQWLTWELTMRQFEG